MNTISGRRTGCSTGGTRRNKPTGSLEGAGLQTSHEEIEKSSEVYLVSLMEEASPLGTGHLQVLYQKSGM